MTQYLLSVHMGADFVPPPAEEMQKMYDDVDKFNKKLQDEGSWVFAGGLHPAEMSTVVRVEDGKVLTTDGPYVEAKEHIGGFWVIEAPDLDAALKLAAEGSAACGGAVEVRPFQDNPS
ncbi:MAG TPA: YciI family protein [Ilumatobacteraceae bacterium]|jgi:hypothetical protein